MYGVVVVMMVLVVMAVEVVVVVVGLVTVTVCGCCLCELLQWGGCCVFTWSVCCTHSLHVFHGQVRAGAMLACGRGQPSIDQWMQFAADSPTNSQSALPFTAAVRVITATINPIRIAVGAVEVSASRESQPH